ncbi:hypothetical protein ACQPZX_22580 [Actinoplanes sp. CA-142083]|uniref:hypothetical protein n=1 Tax=Actinoplanes sp. CA-142083 TaxID=3239903 RepID=UPI003D8E8F4E
MGRREIELRDALAGAWTAARISGGQFRQLVPVYADRMGLAYQVMRGQQIQRRRRAIAVTAILATLGGAAAAVVAARLIGNRTSEEAVAATDEAVAKVDEAVADEAAAVKSEATFTA